MLRDADSKTRHLDFLCKLHERLPLGAAAHKLEVVGTCHLKGSHVHQFWYIWVISYFNVCLLYPFPDLLLACDRRLVILLDLEKAAPVCF